MHDLNDGLALQLDGGPVDGNGHRRHACSLPLHDLFADGSQDVFADRHDETALLGDRNELARGHQTQLRMRPAHQRFESDDAASGDRDLRVIVHDEFFRSQTGQTFI